MRENFELNENNDHNVNKPSEGKSISILELMMLLKRSAFLLIIVGLVFALIGVFYSKMNIKTSYSVSAKIFVAAELDNYNEGTNLSYSKLLTDQFVDLMKTNLVKDKYYENIDNDTQKYDKFFSKNISFKKEEESLFITINYTSYSNKEKAINTLNEVIKSAKEVADSVDENGKPLFQFFYNKMFIFDEAQLVGTSNATLKTIIIFLLAGVLLTYAIIVVRYLLDDTIKTKDQLESATGVNLLAYIEDTKAYNRGNK